MQLTQPNIKETTLFVDKFSVTKNSTRGRNVKEVYHYTQSDKLGQGSYGTVYRATHKYTNMVRAIKVINKAKTKYKERLKMEVATMQQLDHPHIVRLYECYEDDEYIYMVQELCQGGDVFDKVIEKGNFTQDEAQTIFVQMMRSLKYYSHLNVVHRQRFVASSDLKPENFLFCKKDDLTSLYLIDFGLAKKYRPGMPKLSTKAGTAYYVAPEVLAGAYDDKCDIWSIGVILYVLCCGYPPFYGENEKEVLMQVCAAEFTFDGDEWLEFEDQVKELICHMVTKVETRYSIGEVLNHHWIKSFLAQEAAATLQTAKKYFNLDQIQKFAAYSSLKKLALVYLATQLDLDLVLQIKKAFLAINQNQNGFISLQEILEVVTGDQQEITQLFQLCDLNNSGSISYFEFIAICLPEQIFLNESYMKLAYYFLKSNRGDYIDEDSLIECLTLQPTNGEIFENSSQLRTAAQIVNKYNGQLNFTQFENAMKDCGL